MALECIYESNGAVARITLNRPDRLNSFNSALRISLLEAIEQAEADEAVRVVILTGSGRVFCAGADLSEGFPDNIEKQLVEEYKPILAAIHNGRKTWIAQVNGSAAGIGAALAMTCDLVTMAESASIYMAFAAIALIPDGGNTWLLLENMGYHRAFETIVEGKHLSASECAAYGLANKVFPLEWLDGETSAGAQKLSHCAPLALASAKQLLRRVRHMTYEEAIDAEARVQQDLIETADFREGVRAFFAKEKPVFEGK